ncbi:MAG: hypothetical protein ACLTXH_06815 [Enterobacter hormaechei]
MPGVAGIGPVRRTAADGVSESEGIYARLEEVPEKWRKKLEANKEMAFICREIATLDGFTAGREFAAVKVRTLKQLHDFVGPVSAAPPGAKRYRSSRRPPTTRPPRRICTVTSSRS